LRRLRLHMEVVHALLALALFAWLPLASLNEAAGRETSEFATPSKDLFPGSGSEEIEGSAGFDGEPDGEFASGGPRWQHSTNSSRGRTTGVQPAGRPMTVEVHPATGPPIL
jgi:hypothetical protein